MEESKNYRVTCPFCGHVMPITYRAGAICEGVFMRCKGRHCRKVFEVKINKKSK